MPAPAPMPALQPAVALLPQPLRMLAPQPLGVLAAPQLAVRTVVPTAPQPSGVVAQPLPPAVVRQQQQALPLAAQPAPLAVVAPTTAPPAAIRTLTPAMHEIDSHLTELLHLLLRQGAFGGLAPDRQWQLCINLPFCGSLGEAPAMAAFFAEHVLDATPGLKGIRFFGADVTLSAAGTMAAMASQVDGRIGFEVRECDLGCAEMPPAALSIGLHPQPLPKSQLWERIIRNVMRSSERCVFTCWMQAEADELVRIVNAAPPAGAGRRTVVMQRNPSPVPGEGISLRFHYIVIVDVVVQ